MKQETIDLYLTHDDEKSLRDAIEVALEDYCPDDYAVDYIGSIVTKAGIYDDEGGIISPLISDNGYHVNIRCSREAAEKIPQKFIVNPATPHRVWA